jgi:hypothetical protein
MLAEAVGVGGEPSRRKKRDPFFFSVTSGEKSPLLVLQALNPKP